MQQPRLKAPFLFIPTDAARCRKQVPGHDSPCASQAKPKRTPSRVSSSSTAPPRGLPAIPLSPEITAVPRSDYRSSELPGPPPSTPNHQCNRTPSTGTAAEPPSTPRTRLDDLPSTNAYNQCTRTPRNGPRPAQLIPEPLTIVGWPPSPPTTPETGPCPELGVVLSQSVKQGKTYYTSTYSNRDNLSSPLHTGTT